MSISIVINTETAAEARAQLRELLGGGPVSTQPKVDVREVVAALDQSVQNDAGQSATYEDVAAQRLANIAAADINGATDAPKRERGKPSPGHTRRTKAEIAEDEAAATNVSIASMTTLPADATPAEVAEAFAGVVSGAAAIATGDERVGPEDDEATVAQDEADEAAETAAAVAERPADKKLTLDDVRNALGGYVKVYGMDACQQDGPKIITLVCGAGKIKMSDIPDDQAVLQKVVDGVAEMLAKNPFKRTKVA